MDRKTDPRELLKSILQGAAPPRPLFLPIVFSLAARIDNLQLHTFLANPTKITQAVRQIRAHLRSDGITCYFDPYLEIEALGGILEWGASEQPAVRWAQNPLKGDWPDGLRTLDELPTRGRIPVAIEVIRRVKSLVRDECLLTVGISGPFALAAELMQVDVEKSGEAEIAAEALELASGAIAPVAKAFVEAGANVVFIHEQLPLLASGLSDLAALLATTVNIVRFYHAIPVLLLNSRPRSLDPALPDFPDCVVCPVWCEALPGVLEKSLESASINLGFAIPVSAMSGHPAGFEKFTEELRPCLSKFHPALITTPGDVSDPADLKNLNKLRDLLIA
jgi:hypothetical protein